MLKLLSVMKKISDFLYKIQKVLILVGVFALVAINGAQVYCRYVSHASLGWSEQVSVLLFFIMIMLGANLAVKSNSETKIDIVQFKDEKADAALRIVTDILCVGVLIVFILSSLALLKHAKRFHQYLSSIHLDYFYIYIWLLIGFSLVTLDKFVNILKNICCVMGIDTSSVFKAETQEDAK